MTDRQIWVRSSLLADGQYSATVELTDDDSVALTLEAATTYALAVLDAVQAAEYDAAVNAQLVDKVGMAETLVAEFIDNDLRPRRAGLRQTGTALSITPGVSIFDGSGFLTVAINGVPVGQWTCDDARGRALAVLEASLTARYDTSYRAALIEDVGLEPDRAMNMVADVGNHRPGGGR